MRLIKALRILLGIQIIMYIWGMVITWQAGHDDVSDFSGLAAILPFGIFVLLSVVNTILFVIYLIQVFQKKIQPEILIIGLSVIVFLMFVTYPFVIPLIEEPWQPPSISDLQR